MENLSRQRIVSLHISYDDSKLPIRNIYLTHSICKVLPKCLKGLSFGNARFRQKDMQHVMHNSCHLEGIDFSECDFWFDDITFTNRGKSMIKELFFYDWLFHRRWTIEGFKSLLIAIQKSIFKDSLHKIYWNTTLYTQKDIDIMSEWEQLEGINLEVNKYYSFEKYLQYFISSYCQS